MGFIATIHRSATRPSIPRADPDNSVREPAPRTRDTARRCSNVSCKRAGSWPLRPHPAPDIDDLAHTLLPSPQRTRPLAMARYMADATGPRRGVEITPLLRRQQPPYPRHLARKRPEHPLHAADAHARVYAVLILVSQPPTVLVLGHNRAAHVHSWLSSPDSSRLFSAKSARAASRSSVKNLNTSWTMYGRAAGHSPHRPNANVPPMSSYRFHVVPAAVFATSSVSGGKSSWSPRKSTRPYANSRWSR